MRRIRSLLLGLLLLLVVPSLASAADCTLIGTRTAGSFTVTSFYLLDSDTAAATGGLCDLSTWGAPHSMRVSVRSAAGLTGYSAKVEGFDVSGGVSEQLAYVSQSGKAVVVEGATLPRYVRGVSTGFVGTATDFDLIGELYYENATTTQNAATSCDDLVFASVDPTEAGATDDFVDFVDHTGSTTEGNEDNFIVHQTRRAHRLNCSVATAPGAGDIWLVTLRQGAAGSLADTTLTCAISGTDTEAASTGCVDLTAGNVITASSDSSTGATDPDANALITISACLGE